MSAMEMPAVDPVVAYVAEQVRRELAGKRIKQMQVAQLLGLSQPSVARRMSGEIPFDVAELMRIAAVTGREVGSFFPPDNPDERPPRVGINGKLLPVIPFPRRRHLHAVS